MRKSRSLQKIGRRGASEQLNREFEKLIRKDDRLYEKSKKQSAENLIQRSMSMNPTTILGDNPEEVPGN